MNLWTKLDQQGHFLKTSKKIRICEQIFKMGMFWICVQIWRTKFKARTVFWRVCEQILKWRTILRNPEQIWKHEFVLNRWKKLKSGEFVLCNEDNFWILSIFFRKLNFFWKQECFGICEQFFKAIIFFESWEHI